MTGWKTAKRLLLSAEGFGPELLATVCARPDVELADFARLCVGA